MDTLPALINWPLVGLVLALIALFTFRPQIAGLIDRTKRVGKSGLETYETPPSQPSNERTGIAEFFQSFDNPLLVEAERLIIEDLKDRRIETSGDRERALVRSLASTQIILHFERFYGLIWASQFALLRLLNSRDSGMSEVEVRPIYEIGKTDMPSWYENYSFKKWIGFLQNFNIVTEQDSQYFITLAGREFLKYVVAIGKSGPPFG